MKKPTLITYDVKSPYIIMHEINYIRGICLISAKEPEISLAVESDTRHGGKKVHSDKIGLHIVLNALRKLLQTIHLRNYSWTSIWTLL